MAPKLQILFCTDDKESARFVDRVKAGIIEVASIHEIDRPWFEEEFVEQNDLVSLARSHENTGRNVAPQVEQRMHFDRTFAFAKLGPRKQREAKVDGGGVQGVNRLLQVDSERFVGIEGTGLGNEHFGKVLVDAPIALLVGFGQGAAGDLAPNAHVVQFALHGTQTSFDIPQTLPVRELCKGHAEKLIHARKSFDFVIAPVALDAFAKLVLRKKIEQLRENRLATIQ